MTKRPWISIDKHEPPVSSDERRFWLELYIPERVHGDDNASKFKGLALGVYLGSGSFRLQGDRNITLEKPDRWRPLAGQRVPATQQVRVHGQTA